MKEKDGFKWVSVVIDGRKGLWNDRNKETVDRDRGTEISLFGTFREDRETVYVLSLRTGRLTFVLDSQHERDTEGAMT